MQIPDVEVRDLRAFNGHDSEHMSGGYFPRIAGADRHYRRIYQRACVMRGGNARVKVPVDFECGTLGYLISGRVVQHGSNLLNESMRGARPRSRKGPCKEAVQRRSISASSERSR